MVDHIMLFWLQRLAELRFLLLLQRKDLGFYDFPGGGNALTKSTAGFFSLINNIEFCPLALAE